MRGETMVVKSEKLSVQLMRWIARFFGIFLVVGFGFGAGSTGVVLTEVEHYKAVTIHTEDLLMGLAAIIGLVGYVLSWWIAKEKTTSDG